MGTNFIHNVATFTLPNSPVVAQTEQPVIKYDNADIHKLQIVKENKGKSGVYKWTNKMNGNYYVGSSSNLRDSEIIIILIILLLQSEICLFIKL